MTYAIACVILNEIDARGLKREWVQERAGVSGRSFTNYVNGHTDGVPSHQWAKIASVLGLRMSEVTARAEEMLDGLDETDAELLLGVSGATAVKVMRDGARGRRGATDSADPPKPARGRNVRAG